MKHQQSEQVLELQETSEEVNNVTPLIFGKLLKLKKIIADLQDTNSSYEEIKHGLKECNKLCNDTMGTLRDQKSKKSIGRDSR